MEFFFNVLQFLSANFVDGNFAGELGEFQPLCGGLSYYSLWQELTDVGIQCHACEGRPWEWKAYSFGG